MWVTLFEAPFRRGDSNADGAIDIADPVHTLAVLFGPRSSLPCRDAADANDDGSINVSDAVFSLNFIFVGGPAYPAPGHRECGGDPTPDALGCELPAGCVGVASF